MHSLSVDQEWANFIKNNQLTTTIDKENKQDIYIPKVTPIYISTQTKICYLNQNINLQEIFWDIPIIKYQTPKEGVIKKQIKINCETKKESESLNNKIKQTKMIIINNIKYVDNPTAKLIKYKDIRKINVGVSKKDLISYRNKIKSAFYNCFVVIMRIKYNNEFKEIHIKVFNTGKLEIPGIQNDKMLTLALDNLMEILGPLIPNLSYNKQNIDTVLINSNFTCNYFINREKLSHVLKYNYKMHVNYDPCSYPGIQVKFYYNITKQIQDGVCTCDTKCNKKNNKNNNNCLEISFMVFRTGSVLIVGHCDVNILHIVYDFLIKILKEEYKEINIGNQEDKIKKKKKMKTKKKTIIMDLITN